jgi:hypothetical protein
MSLRSSVVRLTQPSLTLSLTPHSLPPAVECITLNEEDWGTHETFLLTSGHDQVSAGLPSICLSLTLVPTGEPPLDLNWTHGRNFWSDSVGGADEGHLEDEAQRQ